MKKLKRRTEITEKTARLVVINRHHGNFLAACDHCGKVVEMVAPDEAAAIVGVSCRVLYRAIEADAIHFIETPQLFICLKSLVEIVKNEPPATRL